jgi:hypothetical protein
MVANEADRRPTMPLSLPIEPEASALLRESPLALLLGMLLDQQMLNPWKAAAQRR